MTRFITLICFSFLSVLCTAQTQQATTTDGKKVVLNNDGTWRYADDTEGMANCDYELREIDEFAGTAHILMKRVRIGKSKDVGLNVKVGRKNDTRIVHGMYSGDLGCLDNEAFMMLKLKNGKMVKLMHDGPTKCGKNAPMKFTLSTDDIRALKASPVSIIRVKGTKYSADVDQIEVANYFIDNLNCVLK